MTTRWTDADDQTLRDLHATGMSLTAIAKQMGWSKGTIGPRAKTLGLTFSRARTAKATEAVVIDARARRAKLEMRFLEEAERSLDRMWNGQEIGAFAGADGEYKHAWVDEPNPQDRKAIMQTAATASAAAAKLTEMAAGTEIDTAKSALTRFRKALEATEIDDD